MLDIFEMYSKYLVIIFNKKVDFYCASPDCFKRGPWRDSLDFVQLTYVIHEMRSISGYMCCCHHAGVCASKGKIIIIVSFLGLFGLVLGFKPFGGLTFLVSP